LRAVIVEDEHASRETLASYLARYCPQVELCGMADSVKPALELIHKQRPDLVFLDIEMPFGNGFDLLEQVGNIDFDTIFITAFSEYALKAIQVSAAHYLLKPVDIEELVSAVQKVAQSREREQQFLHTRILVENVQLENKQLHKVVLPTMDGFEVIRIKDIIRCEAADNFTEFHLQEGGKKLICRSLKHYEELFADFDFIRVHKSHLINRHYVSRYRKGKGGTVEMSNGDQVEVSATRKQEFLAHFSTLK
ncbi:MAG: LytR/AlgR family response regulator transcription factor, partial [Owenweeksia sp.]